MSIHILRLGSPRSPGEGPRLGTVRRPPRGVPKAEFASRDFYDTWLPALAPSAELMAEGRAVESEEEWGRFTKRFRREMAEPAASQLLDLLALLSHDSDMALGCYCEEERRCHRSVLRELLQERGASLA
ncbi:Conserved hypothetical protein [Pseudomonas knackmussii B13]|uniref:DUF488 domain-containing protein n=1 Tax=Pseudomonas knackmussii (strain DSM 6978 / CCUG 54928 / LMG 23759 / B13) TaxID=1301098 RepID=A0A024HGN7_PSEKB|nr:DUF488 family protein [Pseudomonas knackmussii]CDF83819.1 Conserved hypothetical protein [Pseudomonas knackmussii B13]